MSNTRNGNIKIVKYFLELNAASCVTNKDLNTYIASQLQPDSEFNSRCGECVDKIASFLRNESNLSVAEVIKVIFLFHPN